MDEKGGAAPAEGPKHCLQNRRCTSRADLRRGIKKAKHCYKLKIESHFSNSDPRQHHTIISFTDHQPFTLSSPNVHTALSLINAHKSA